MYSEWKNNDPFTHLKSCKQHVWILVVQEENQAGETALVLNYHLPVLWLRSQVPKLSHHRQCIHHLSLTLADLKLRRGDVI